MPVLWEQGEQDLLYSPIKSKCIKTYKKGLFQNPFSPLKSLKSVKRTFQRIMYY